jgi:hypothetical protein
LLSGAKQEECDEKKTRAEGSRPEWRFGELRITGMLMWASLKNPYFIFLADAEVN